MNQTKAWIMPQLVVLSRSRSQEAVLLDCKSSKTSGANVMVQKCGQNPGSGTCTSACHGNSGQS